MSQAVIVNKKVWRISPIWFLPITALLLSAWLAYESYMHKGVSVTIHFTTGSGIVINKTKVMYKGITIGKVTDVEIDQKNIEEVIVTIMLDNRTQPYLLTDTKFWLVQPSISLGGISGLDTLMSGNYIAIRPGVKGESQSTFIALKEAPIDVGSTTDLVVDLEAKTLDSIVSGSPVYFKKMQVGKVLGAKLNKHNNVSIKLKVEQEYSYLVRKHSRFYNVSGIEITGGLNGIKVKTDSFASMLMGGIAFYNPTNTYLDEAAENDDVFPLFDDFELADIGIPIHLNLKDAESISENSTEIRYLGKKVGFIKKLNINYKTSKVSAIAYIDPAAEYLLASGTKIWKVEPVLSINRITGIETLISGVYLAIRSTPSLNQQELQPKSIFDVLDVPPALDSSEPGLHLNLTAEKMSSLQIGSGIYFKNIKVGSVQSYVLESSGSTVDIKIFIKPQYSQLIKPTTKFYNNSGISIKGGLMGLSMKLESLSTIISGGISIYNSPLASVDKGKKITNGHITNGHGFQLYDDLEKATLGKEITLFFSDVNGIKEDITRLIYKGIDLGYVYKIVPDKKIKKIKVLLKIDSTASHLLKTNSKFWLVKPEISLSGVKGLDTLLGGSYITFKAGNGKQSNTFTALKTAPLVESQDNGLLVTVKTIELGSITKGSPVLYHQLPVGLVNSYYLDKKGENIIVNLYIKEKYKKLVTANSRFYQASGISIKGGLSGLDIRAESLASIIQGGIAFFTSKTKLREPKKLTQSSYNKIFDLFSDLHSAQKNQFKVSVAFPSTNGLEIGSKLKFNGLVVGEVKSLNLHTDLEQVIVGLLIDNKLRKIMGENSRFRVAKAEFGLAQTKHLGTLISGNYIILEPVKGRFSDYFEAQERKSTQGLSLILESHSLGSIGKDNPVYYRQIKVGKVVDYKLSNTADKVLINIIIEQKYAPLVRGNSKFWNASGINMDINLFAGSKIKTESLQSIVDGGISFASPSSSKELAMASSSTDNFDNSKSHQNLKIALAKKAKQGSVFTLHKEVDTKWLEWNPKIQIR